MAETLTTLKACRSCRAYKPEHVEDEKLNAIIEAGTYAATGMGKQSPIILVVKDQKIRDRLTKIRWVRRLIHSMVHQSFWWYWQTKTVRHISAMVAL